MATRKKKPEVIIDATGPDVVKIVKGNHLTVTTFPNGRTELVWDDEALLDEVRAAILSVETAVPEVTKPKRTRKSKEV